MSTDAPEEVPLEHRTTVSPAIPASAAATVEPGPGGAGLQVLRLVIDAVQECNLRCKYCHPGKVWVRQHLDVEHVRLVAAEDYGTRH